MSYIARGRRLHPNKEDAIWNKLTVGMLAIAAVATAHVLLRRKRPPDHVEVQASEVTDVQDLYAAGL